MRRHIAQPCLAAAAYTHYSAACTTLGSFCISASNSSVGLQPRLSACTRECVFVRARTPAWLCICASLFMPVKSCYRRQQRHCSPPKQPPWHKSLTAACSHDCPTLLPPFTFSSAWKATAASFAHSDPWLLSIVREESEYVTQFGPQFSNVLGQNAGRQIVVRRKDVLLVFFPPPFFMFFPSAWLIPVESAGGSRSQAQRCTKKEVTVQSDQMSWMDSRFIYHQQQKSNKKNLLMSCGPVSWVHHLSIKYIERIKSDYCV